MCRESVGAQIPGSRLFRAYCRWCHGPMRVTESDLEQNKGNHCCTDCDGKIPPCDEHLTPRQRAGSAKTKA